jgi:hypothetical protein
MPSAMTEIACDRSRRRDPASGIESSETCQTEAKPRPSAVPIDRVRTNPDVDAFYKSLRATPMGKAIESAEQAAATQRRIDGVRDRFSGPYTVDGQTVTARPMFRINIGHNTKQMETHAKELAKIASGKVANLRAVQMGCCRPEDLVKVTQALIDAGKLPPGPPSTLEDRIRDMQWEWGIGVDCAAYTRATLTAATGKTGRELGLAPLGTESFVGLGGNPHFKKVGIADVRPGDLITLRATGDYGHNVIVHGHFVVNDAKKADLVQKMGPRAQNFLTGSGPFHAIEVDSSWGAGSTGEKCGGYRRDTWLYDESTKMWGYVDPHASPPAFKLSATGPAGDDFHGAYRAR